MVGNNNKDYDIIAVHNVTHNEVLIQVKTSSTNSNRWRVSKNDAIYNNLFYVLVSIKNNEPSYYILSSKEAVRIRDDRHIAKGNDINDNKMREIVLDEKLLEKYKNNWQILIDYTIKERS